MLKVINWNLSFGWGADLTAARILEKAGEDRLREAFPAWPDRAPLIIPEESKSLALSTNPTREIMLLVEHLTSISSAGASNSWVVSGEKSATGKPILANDTHLALNNPSVWWEVHLVCPTMNVSGFVLPGTPGIAVGHNGRVAWGVTNVMVDDVDFFIERINPVNPRQYWYMDHWEDMDVIEETIRVKGEDPVEAEILLTRHGPMVNEVKEGSKQEPLSARWAYGERPQPIEAAYLLAKARDVGEVMEALRYWEVPGQNFVFADTAGNIGYCCCATIPMRPHGHGLLPVPGWDKEYEWNGYVPSDERPHLINPEEGFIATANNKVVGDDYPWIMGNYWEPMDRITRIRQLLTAKEELSVEDFRQMHQDVYCPLAAEITPVMIQVLDQRFYDEEGEKAKDILSRWDFMMGKDSAGACLFEVAYRRLMEDIFRDELGEELFQEYLKTAPFAPRAIRMMIRKGSSPWFDDVNTPEQETMEDIMARSMSHALSGLKEVLGADMGKWRWGKIHTLTFNHVIGTRKPLDRIFNLGPFPVGGSHLTVNKKQYSYDKPYEAVHGVSQRMIVDLADMDSALHVLPTGESGHLSSPHYKDQTELYLLGKYHPAWKDRQDVEEHAEAILILRPPVN